MQHCMRLLGRRRRAPVLALLPRRVPVANPRGARDRRLTATASLGNNLISESQSSQDAIAGGADN